MVTDGRSGPRGKTGHECAFDGCTLPVIGRDLCRGHYTQWYRGTDLKPLRIGPGRRKKGE